MGACICPLRTSLKLHSKKSDHRDNESKHVGQQQALFLDTESSWVEGDQLAAETAKLCSGSAENRTVMTEQAPKDSELVAGCSRVNQDEWETQKSVEETHFHARMSPLTTHRWAPSSATADRLDCFSGEREME